MTTFGVENILQTFPLIYSNRWLQHSVHTDECVTNDKRLGGHHALTPDVRGNHSGLTGVTFDLLPALCHISHTGSRYSAL